MKSASNGPDLGGGKSAPIAPPTSDLPRGLKPMLWRCVTRAYVSLRPGPRAWRGATRGLVATGALVYLPVAGWLVLVGGKNAAVDVVLLALPLLALLAGGLGLLILRLLGRLPSSYVWALTSVGGLCAAVLVSGKVAPLGAVVSTVVCLAVGSLGGASVQVLATTGGQSLGRQQQRIARAGLAAALMLAGTIGWWLAQGGTQGKQITRSALEGAGAGHGALPNEADPSQPGAFRVLRMTYGSGTDSRRPEFGEGVSVRTHTVDGSKLVKGWTGSQNWARTRYWGFDARQLPLQARVWHPDGPGPFPLVLFVHGNHTMEVSSDAGYEYLGAHLASRGFIFASVDETFLNGSLADLAEFPNVGLNDDLPARGWMLLEHLRLWRGWNSTPGELFHGRVDLDRIAVGGHSRGGEAATVAAAFNRLPCYPGDARQVFDFGFNIRSVAAIAPTDSQNKAGGDPLRLKNVNYFVLHGSLDVDVQSFQGSRVLQRMRFDDGGDWIKASLYVHRANHGQFNTSWGRSDTGGPYSTLLNSQQILPAAQQERVASVFVSAFLEATLHDHRAYRRLLRDWREGRAWLPETVYLQKYEEARSHMLATFEEDLDLTTTSAPGGRIRGENLSDWQEKAVPIKRGALDTHAAFLGWDRNEAPGRSSYLIELPEVGLPTTRESSLFFSLADSGSEPSSHNEGAEAQRGGQREGRGSRASRDGIDLTLEVVDRAGNQVQLPLSHFSALQRQVQVQVMKASLMNESPSSEIVFQTFEVPLSDFATANPKLDPTALRSVRLIFDRTERGVIALDDIGFRP